MSMKRLEMTSFSFLSRMCRKNSVLTGRYQYGHVSLLTMQQYSCIVHSKQPRVNYNLLAKSLFPFLNQLNEGTRGFSTSSRTLLFENKDAKDLTLWKNLKEVRSSPVPALSLGLAGLIPFVAVPTYMITSSVFLAYLAHAQVVYGACILSFLGGVRWGFTIPEENPVKPDWVNLCYSVTPSLIAWGGLLLPAPYSVLTIMSGIIFAGYCDMAMYGYPAWFKGLRFFLSFFAVLALWTTFICSFMLKDKETKEQNIEE